MKYKYKSVLLFLDINGVVCFTNDSRYFIWGTAENSPLKLASNRASFKRENFLAPHMDPIALSNLRALVERNKDYKFYICFCSSHKKEVSDEHPYAIRNDVAKVLKGVLPGFKHMVVGSVPKDINLPRPKAIEKIWKDKYSLKPYHFDKVLILDDSVDPSEISEPIKVFRPVKKRGLDYKLLLKIEEYLRSEGE